MIPTRLHPVQVALRGDEIIARVGWRTAPAYVRAVASDGNLLVRLQGEGTAVIPAEACVRIVRTALDAGDRLGAQA